MKDLGKTKFCLGLQIEHLKDGILVHQEAYIEKLLKIFYMDKSHSLSTPIVVRTLDVKNDQFQPRDVDEEILGPEASYLSAIGALMFLASHTRPDITFSLNLLARYSSLKQAIAATSSNHAEILAIHEASRERVWLRNATQRIHRSCSISSENEAPTVLYKDNAACIARLKEYLCYGSYSTKARRESFRDYKTSRLQDMVFWRFLSKGFVKKIVWTAKAQKKVWSAKENEELQSHDIVHSQYDENDSMKPFFCCSDGNETLVSSTATFANIMCRQPLPPALSPPSAKLMIMALEEYGYQSRRGIRVPKK
ncbi:hypothetical protein Tco_0792796 [Tanacetum coccineum]